MRELLNEIIVKETEAVEELLNALDEQYGFIVKNDVFGMEECVSRIEKCNKTLAEWEVKRRSITNGKAMSEIVSEVKDEELESNHRKIKRLLEELRLQKETNDLLLKQGLSFTAKMLNIMNPDRGTKIYNSYGKVKR